MKDICQNLCIKTCFPIAVWSFVWYIFQYRILNTEKTYNNFFLAFCVTHKINSQFCWENKNKFALMQAMVNERPKRNEK